MAGWLTAFKVIPWGDVIAAAPTVARGAKKLWDSIREQPAAPVITSYSIHYTKLYDCSVACR